ncbi:hypothetical protein GCM10023310_28690 [Paenibacillus vulneris]|uniref:Stalk domain-containing protein n=1 Tax=Paenibacillus vulneris TaxID=1133364 RepID=A0ABW3UQC7_9BACL
MGRLSFFTGLCAGIGLSLCTAAAASDTIQAMLFPSKVHILLNGSVKEIHENEDPVINYNNKAYIPLRAFAEAMGAAVQYRPTADGTKNIIDIYAGMSESDFTSQDLEGYVSLAHPSIQYAGKNNQTGFTDLKMSGFLRVNKDLFNKKIQLDILDQQDQIIGSTDMDFFNDLQEGDIVPLNQTIHVRGDMHSYRIRVNDTWSMTTTTGYHDGMLLMDEGLVFGMGRLDPARRGLVHSLQFKNQGKQPIRIEPLHIEFQIVKVEPAGDRPLFQHKLAPLEGTVPVYAWYDAKLPVWDLKDLDGRFVAPGKYAAQIILPDSLTYWTEGISEPQYLNKPSRFVRWEYDITQSDLDAMK